MGGDARQISVYDLSVLFSVCKAMELSVLLVSSIYQGILLLHRKKCLEREGCACCKDPPML